ncbi:2-polyprenyl-3-methyl-6-methoxy-1,4-benzoquinone monooxygenase [Cupriavidus basilensis]|uniref:2-polyprenyl-3-methyl-6-methoxy-1,4-benzoquinone monooxygenase n=1 Tax=Cupriavidus basilensis TaxID=68895 RepID=UPI000750EF2A|nr:2-polyprenyl-3-methyl-6-methoxy-1,4-benzoquinone monooxygenase [Cupriavidus basilensis]
MDTLIREFDVALRAIAGVTRAERANPAAALAPDDGRLDERERHHVAGLMRINHVGEVCAQALYQAQKLTAHTPQVRAQMDQAAREEEDHLGWCAERLRELGSRTSLLNPLWYAGAFAIGWAAGRAGDRVSLGFVSETESQVEQHLNGHLEQLPAADQRSRAILEQMRDDEVRHGATAREAGGIPLPAPVRAMMRAASRVMTTAAYRI